MLRPSYAELMDTMNENSEEHVTSRYTVVIAAAKRARQIIDGDEPMADEEVDASKPVSIAVEEIKEGKISIVPEGHGTKLKPVKSDKELEIKKELEEKVSAEEKSADSEFDSNEEYEGSYDESEESIEAEFDDEYIENSENSSFEEE